MPDKGADPAIVQLIRRLAGEGDRVRTTRAVRYDLMGNNLTVDDLCDAICEWIDEGETVQEIVTTRAKGHIGKPAYVMKPRLRKTGYYVKVSVEKRAKPDECLLIVSAHPHH